METTGSCRCLLDLSVSVILFIAFLTLIAFIAYVACVALDGNPA